MMVPQELASGVWRITTPLPYRPRSVHAYLIRFETGDGYALIDGGLDHDDARSALDAGVRAVAGGWDGIRLQVVTHMHVDHMGLVPFVVRNTGAPVAMGRLDAERAEHAHRHPEDEAEYRAQLLRECNATDSVIDEVQQSRAAGTGGRFVPPSLLLDGEVSEIPGFSGWRFVWTPGHTAGHMSLFRPEDRTLIAGDAVLSRVTPTIGVNRQREDPVGDYLNALDRLEALQPARILPGHNEPPEDPVARIQELRMATEGTTQSVAMEVSVEPATVWQLAHKRYWDHDLPSSMRMHALRETRAHLDHLRLTGKVEMDVLRHPSGVLRFRRR